MPRVLFQILFGCCALLQAGAQGGEAWRTITATDGLPDNAIQFLKEDASGAVWIGTAQGLSLYRDGKPTTVLSGSGVYDVLPAGDGKYWVGTESGVVLLDGQKKESFLKNSRVAPIVRYDAKTVYAISKDRASERNTLVANDGSGWTPVERFKGESIVDLLATSNGHLWAIVDGNGVLEIDPAKGPAQATHHLKGRNVNVVAEDSKNQVWAGLWGGGVMLYDGKTWAPNLEKEKSTVFAIRGDAKGGVWVATSADGLWRLDGGKWSHLLADEGSVNMLAIASDGGVWISTQMSAGLRRWDGAQWKTELESTLSMSCLLETKDKKIWAGGALDGVHVRP